MYVIFLSVTATSDVWTGLNDLFIPGMFAWSDEHMVTFTYWAPGEPNNHNGFSEDCVEMLHQVRKIVSHTIKIHFILQIDKIALNRDHFNCRLISCSRLADGTTCPVQSSILTYAKSPKHITQCPP